jgi:hypothetical protein
LFDAARGRSFRIAARFVLGVALGGPVGTPQDVREAVRLGDVPRELPNVK